MVLLNLFLKNIGVRETYIRDTTHNRFTLPLYNDLLSVSPVKFYFAANLF